MTTARAHDVETVRQLNEGYIAAAQASDAAWFDKNLAACFMASNPDGSLVDRSSFLDRIGRPHTHRTYATVDPHVSIVGDVGVVDSGFRLTTAGGTEGLGHYTDVYAYLDGRWQCVSAHFALRPSPPQAGASKTAEIVAGAADPADHAALEALNRHYIRSVQESDVRWFDANLAPEFTNGNADGTFADRTAFLAFVGKPCPVSHLRADTVRIQVLGNVGIIHARTAYTKPDGQPGVGRYTDIWWRAQGRWLCVSAHVTRG